jgi:hypothetical protein
MNVGVEPHHNARGINRKDSRRNLRCIDQVECVPAEIHSSSQLSEQAALWLPGDAIGEPALDLEAFFPLHPRIDGAKHIPRVSRNGSGCSRIAGAGDLRDKSSLFGHVDTCSFFSQRLIDGGGVESDFVSYVEELTFADEIAGIGERTGALKLRRPGENALERLSVEQSLSRRE